MYKSKTVEALAINLILSMEDKSDFFRKLNYVLGETEDNIIRGFFATAMRSEDSSANVWQNTRAILKALWLTSSENRIHICKFILYKLAIGQKSDAVKAIMYISDKSLKESKLDIADVLCVHIQGVMEYPTNNNIKDCIKNIFASLDESYLVFPKYAEIQEVIDEALKDLERA